jgi:hypothetical protein
MSRPSFGRGTSGTARAVSSATCLRCTMRSTTKASAAGASSTMPTTAPIEKFCWPITCL